MMHDTRSSAASTGALAQSVFFVLGTVVLAVMAMAAHTAAYFPGDVAISHAAQTYHPEWLDASTGALSWLGIPPQTDVLFGVVVILLFVSGARWGAVSAGIAALLSGGVYLLLQLVVAQPRPSADLVRVAGPIQLTSFPSGHLATFTAVFGFVAYLGYRRLAPSPRRWWPVVVVGFLLVLMSFARIYAGQHWASDVFAGWLLGGLCLVLVIRLYTWGEGRFFRSSHEAQRAAVLTG